LIFPDNILVEKNRKNNKLHKIKITDFGLSAQFTEKEDENWASRNCGTGIFKAPELLIDNLYSKVSF